MRKNSGAGGINHPDFRLYYKDNSHQDNVVLAQNINIDQWKKIESPEISPCTYGYLIFHKGGKKMQWRKGNLFHKWCWVQWGLSLANSAGRGQAPSGDCGFQDTSSVPFSFCDVMLVELLGPPHPQLKASRHSLEAHRGTAPRHTHPHTHTHSSETLLSPTAQGIMLSISPREFSAHGEDTPSLRHGVDRCFPCA